MAISSVPFFINTVKRDGKTRRIDFLECELDVFPMVSFEVSTIINDLFLVDEVTGDNCITATLFLS